MKHYSILMISVQLCLFWPFSATADLYSGVDLTTPGGEHLVLKPGDTVSTQTGSAIRIHGTTNRLSGDGVSVLSGTAAGVDSTAGIHISSAGRLTLSNSTVHTQGVSNAAGVVVQHVDSSAVLDYTSISTMGDYSTALYVGAGANAKVTGGVVRTDGYSAHGLFAEGRGSTITATGTALYTTGYGTAVVRVTDKAHVRLDNVKLFGQGEHSSGIDIGRGIVGGGGSVTATNTEIIARGVGAAVGGTLTLSQSSIKSYGDGVILFSNFPNEPVKAFLTDVAVDSENGRGLNVQIKGSYALLERVQLSSSGDGLSGIYIPVKSEVHLKDSTITTTGVRTVGVDNRNGTFTMEGGKVTTHGNASHGLYASENYTNSGGKATIAAKDVVVETFGDGSIGVVSRTGVSDVSLDGATVITHGTASFGILANGAKLTAAGTTVRTEGAYSSGLKMGNRGVQVALDSMDIRTSGKGSDGVNIYAATNGVDHQLTLLNSYIETEDGNGITVEGAGVTANLIGTTVIAKSREPGVEGAALYVSDWASDNNPNASVSARHVELTAQRSTLLGDIVLDSGSANVHLRDNSSLTGALLNRSGRMVDQFSIDDSSAWRVRNDSSVNNLQTTGTVSFMTSSTDFKVLDIAGTLSGGGLFEMRSDVGAGKSDQLRVDTVEGSHRILMVNSGAEPTTEQGVSISLIQTEGGAGTFTLANRDQVVDVGTYRYELKTDNTIGGRVSDWSLVNTARLVPPVGPEPKPKPEPDPDPNPEPEIPLPPEVIHPKPEHLSTAANAAINTSASSTAQSIWFAESAVLLRRMGELRLSGGSDGVWMRGFGERQKLDNRGARHFSQRVSGLQLGADNVWPVEGGRWYMGLLAGYSGVDRKFQHEGSGNGNSFYLGSYAIWLADSGWYVDTVVKANQLKQRFRVEATDGRTVKGRTSQNMLGVMVDVGRRLTWGESDWFAEPQVGISAVYVGSDHYRTSNGLEVRADAGSSLRLRTGLSLGRRIALADGNVLQPYVRVMRAYEFDGKSMVRTNGIGTRTDLYGDVTELGVGVTASLGSNHNLYLNYDYESGARLDKPWSVSLGYNYRF